MSRTVLLAVCVMTALGVGACARSSRTYQTSAGGVAPADAVALHVQNDNFADMDVYVVSEGLATRLGTATGLSSTNFTLDPSFFPTSELRIVATPIGGNGRASSGPLIVNAGQTIEFRIAPRLRQSTASVR